MNPTLTYEQSVANANKAGGDKAVLANLANAQKVNPNQFAPSTPTSTAVPNVITPSSLAPTKDITLPTTPVPTIDPKVGSFVDSTKIKADQVATQQEPPATEKGTYQKIAESVGLTKPESLADAYKEATSGTDLVEKKRLATQLSNEIMASDKAFRDRVNAIRQNTSGQFGGAVEQEVRKAQSEYDNDRANKAIAYNVALGDYNAAKEGIDTLFNIQMKDIENDYNYKKSLVDSIYEDLTAKEKAQADLLKEKRQQEFEMKKMAVNFEYDKRIKQMGIDADRVSNAGGTPTLTGKPQNATQATANGYANRINESNVVINNLGSKFSGKLAIGGALPNMFQSAERQSYEQAKRNFITAVLRRESGASIAPSEFETAEKQYFPQQGDKQETVEQKEKARNTVINNFYNEANVLRPVMPNDIIQSGGKKYKVGMDGETLTEIK